MNNFSIIDPNFDKNITTSYFLSIQLTLDGFSFCVLDPVSNEYIQFQKRGMSLKETTFETLKKELSTNELLVYPYQKVFVTYYTCNYTLIPTPLFNSASQKEFLNFSFTESTKESISLSNKIKMADSVCTFSVPIKTYNLLKQYYKDIHFFCQATPFIESALLKTTIDSNYSHVHIDLQLSSFDIIVTSGNNLKMHNCFNYQNKEEFLYYTLLVFEQLKLDTHSTSVFLSGKVDKTNDIYNLLKKYIKQVEIKKETKHFKFSNIFKNIPLQDQLNLFNTPLCV